MLHAGTALRRRTAGRLGRRPGAVGGRRRHDLAEAREQAYAAVDRIGSPGGHHRTDIALAAELGEIRVP